MLNHTLPTELLHPTGAPCLSLYQPTHRRHPDNQQDPIRFKNLVKSLEATLRKTMPAAAADEALAPFAALADDHTFWKHTLDGLAVLGAPGVFRVMHLQQPVPERAVVADSFHVKPLWRCMQGSGRYQVLGLSLHKVCFYEGNRDVLDEVDLKERFGGAVPTTIEEALGHELTTPHHAVNSYGGVGGNRSPMHHGHGGRAAESEVDAERFFRAVDRAVHEHCSKPSALPLLLAAQHMHHALFRRVSHNPYLVKGGVPVFPGAIDAEGLRSFAWEVMRAELEKPIRVYRDQFKSALSRGKGSGLLEEVALAAVSGRIETLLIDGDCTLPGRLDLVTGEVALDEDGTMDPVASVHDDVLDDLGELVTRCGGRALVLPHAEMPTRTGVAAIFRG